MDREAPREYIVKNAVTSRARGVCIRAGWTRAMRNSISIVEIFHRGLNTWHVPEARPVRVALVHARVARFDGFLYAITLPGSQSASLSVRFKMGGRPSTP